MELRVQVARSLAKERAVLVGVCFRHPERREMEEHLDELKLLAETAGATVVDRLVQDRGAVNPATLIRRGKLDELILIAREHEADLAIFDEDLSPAQVRNLERELKLKILDRSALILDIFARRARSREARTQVELAQMRYMLPRLTRQWGHLSRQDGGIGQRGVGETQLEIDRRLVRHRITRLARDLKRIEMERRERRKSRAGIPRVALIGYTNAGKSTVMNMLTRAETLVENRLFATLDSLVRRCERGGREPFLLIDTVGFIRKLPHHLVASFRGTLEEAADADLLLHVIDASSPALDDHLKTTRMTVEQLGLGDHSCLMVFNKIDRVGDTVLRRLRSDYDGAVFLSALDSAYADQLEKAVRHALVVRPATAPLDVPSNGTFAPLRSGRAGRQRKGVGAVGRRSRRPDSRPASRRSGERAGGGRSS